MNWERFFVVGPTASGKSGLALALAQKFSGLIINSDSLQFFKDLKIGTAYPSEADFEKVPHHLFGICDLEEEFTAGEFVRRYHKFEDQLLVSDASTSSVLPRVRPLLIVGGSGFYIRALETGMFPVAQDSMTADLPREHEGWPKEKKLEFLKEHDPEYLAKIGVNDLYRIDRAIQLFLAEGKTMTEFHEHMQEQKKNHLEAETEAFAFKLGVYVERDELLERVKERTHKMLTLGLIDEVKALDEKVKNKQWKPLQSVGYKETLDFIQGEGVKTQDELYELIVKNTMNLAKRQMTWFRSDPDVVWFHSQKDELKAMLWMEEQLEQYLD
ncbi:MAG: tRNA (adenosine(37)-N6)-dimethylallyltransferase MiaA [Bdellovibrionaceae bacterium]|nr:tRNA (adenosine(37)-N6)-dimethylallyltransferase MiaA [Pseudobdellovibrionaceae bacterium]